MHDLLVNFFIIFYRKCVLFRSEAIEYNGDLLTPPDQKKKQKPPTYGVHKRTIRGGDDDSDDDLDLSDWFTNGIFQTIL